PSRESLPPHRQASPVPGQSAAGRAGSCLGRPRNLQPGARTERSALRPVHPWRPDWERGLVGDTVGSVVSGLERLPKRAITAGATLLVSIVFVIAVGGLPRASAGQRMIKVTGPLVVLSPATGKVVAAAPAFAPANASVST